MSTPLHCTPPLPPNSSCPACIANTVTACCAVLKHSQCAVLQCCQCCHVPPCCRWLIVALTLFLLSFVSPVIRHGSWNQSMHRTMVLLTIIQSPLLLLASSPSLVHVAVAAAACRFAPLCRQCCHASITATVVSRLLSLLASFCCRGTNFEALLFLHDTVTMAGLCHSLGNAHGIFAVTAG